MKTLFSWILSQPMYFIKSREVVVPPRMHRLSNIGKQHIETHLNQGVEFLYLQNMTNFAEIPKSAQLFNDLQLLHCLV